MTTEWVINASPTHIGVLHSQPRLQDHIQGLQHNQQGLQHLQQGGGIKIQPCGYKDLVNWVQGASRCFKAQTHSVRDQGTAGGTWWHQ